MPNELSDAEYSRRVRQTREAEAAFVAAACEKSKQILLDIWNDIESGKEKDPALRVTATRLRAALYRNDQDFYSDYGSFLGRRKLQQEREAAGRTRHLQGNI